MELGRSYLNLPSALLPKGAAQTEKVPFFYTLSEGGQVKNTQGFKDESGVRGAV